MKRSSRKAYRARRLAFFSFFALCTPLITISSKSSVTDDVTRTGWLNSTSVRRVPVAPRIAPKRSSQEPLPRDFEEKARQRFNKIAKPEVTFEQYLEFETQEFQRQRQLEKNPRLAYQPVVQPTMTDCGNGDFETTLNAAEWQGASGTVPGSGDPVFSSFTAGITPGNSPGPIASATSRQTWVSAGPDPYVPILRTAQGSAGAVRIGNAANGAGSELLSKTFTVTSAQSLINFWYAVVFQDPGHPPAHQPSFWVRVTDSSGNVIPGLVNLGNGTDKLVADGNNPFFQKQGALVYKDWSCAQIDLSQHLGQTVTVEFVTEDCTQTAHYGYAYIDRFCGNCAGSPTGNIAFAPATSSNCGRGGLCFNYSLPTAGGNTGSVTIALGIYQNGTLLANMASPVLTSGSSYCFNITPAGIPGINAGLGGFDFVATGAFALTGSTPAPMSVGAVPDGRLPGLNNDYQITCTPATPTPRWCCPGRNLVRNGGFEAGNTGFTSQYTFNAATALGATLPGQYNIVNGTQALSISPNWVAADHTTCNANSGNFLVVNGKTTQTGVSKSIWQEIVPVTGGKEYRFCANVKNLPQCTFDIKPKIEVSFSVPPNVAPLVVNVPPSNACAWQSLSATVIVPTGTNSLTVDILLDESGLGDGNDLALDDISLQLKPPVNPSYVLVNIATNNIGGGQYTVSANPINLPAGYGYFWEVCELNSSGNCIAATTVTNPSAWWLPFPNDFKGYVGTSTLGPLTNPGKFDFSKRYQIKFGAWSDCEAWAESRWILQYNTARQKAEFIQVKQPAQNQAPPLDRGKGVSTRRP